MLKILFIGIGGALGTMIRYVVSGLDYRFSNGIFPVSTLVVNATGCLIIGFLWGLFERIDVSSTFRMFIFIGILGGYTTFSTFGLENFNLFRDGEFKIAVLNILTTNLVGIACVIIGFSLSKFIFSFTR